MGAPLRLGLIGVGRWGRVYIRTVSSMGEQARLTHICTSQPKNAELIPHPVTVTADWAALVRADCDAVIIASPPHLHAEMVEACLDAGKPCLVEKPLCLDVATAERLHQRIRKAGVPVLVNHTHLFNSAYLGLKRAVEQAGEPVRLILAEGGSLGPFRSHTPALWDWCPHDISLCLDLLGRPPTSVDALGGAPNPRGEADAVSLRLKFPEEAHAWVQASRLVPQKRRSLTVFTETRMYCWDDLAAEKLTAAPIAFSRRYENGIPESPAHAPIPPTSGLPPMVNVVTYFLEGMAGGDRSRFGAELGLEVVRVLAACERALSTGAAGRR